MTGSVGATECWRARNREASKSSPDSALGPKSQQCSHQDMFDDHDKGQKSAISGKFVSPLDFSELSPVDLSLLLQAFCVILVGN